MTNSCPCRAAETCNSNPETCETRKRNEEMAKIDLKTRRVDLFKNMKWETMEVDVRETLKQLI